MGGKDDSASVKRMPSIDKLVEAVSKEPAALAYIGLGHALAQHEKIKIEDVRLIEGGPAVQPSQTSITNNYPLSRPLLIIIDENAKASVRDFVDFCASSTGQNLVHETGYVKAH